ncbi:MAG TPA: tetratricopeptide repeat protein [Thermodesulfobacteriota bacterium]|nr:tetratricopeptide repeat protein [Thermodesulfobacteriota bacterium]
MRGLRSVLCFVLLLVTASCGHIIVKPEAKDALSPEESFRLAAIYESKGEEELALREYLSAAERGYAEAYFAMANIHIKKAEYGEAESALLKAIEADPTKGRYYNNLGWVYMETGRLKEAEEAVERAMRQGSSEHPAYLDTLGLIQMKGERFTEAEKTFTRALSLSGNGAEEGTVEIYGHLLELYRRTGQGEKAAGVEERLRELKKPSK